MAALLSPMPYAGSTSISGPARQAHPPRLVNFSGVLAFLVLVVLALLALPHIRRRWYDVFVR